MLARRDRELPHRIPALSDPQIAAIQAVPHLAAGGYRDLDIQATLEFYVKRYVDQLAQFREVDGQTTIMAVGAGYGWLAIAFALSPPARLIAVELDGDRLAAQPGTASQYVLPNLAAMMRERPDLRAHRQALSLQRRS